MIKKPSVNNQIRASKVRVIDETGKQLGVLSLKEALRMARERNLDLIQVTEKVEPPVCKIMEYGKYLYQEEKKEKTALKNKRERNKRNQIDFQYFASRFGNQSPSGRKILKRRRQNKN